MPRLSQMALPDFPQEAIRALLVKKMAQRGLRAGDADEITDLAIHAVNSARRALLETCERASSLPMEMSALHLACGLIEHDAHAINAALEASAGDIITILQEGTANG